MPTAGLQKFIIFILFVYLCSPGIVCSHNATHIYRQNHYEKRFASEGVA